MEADLPEPVRPITSAWPTVRSPGAPGRWKPKRYASWLRVGSTATGAPQGEASAEEPGQGAWSAARSAKLPEEIIAARALNP